MFTTICRLLPCCVRNVAGWLELTRVIFPMSVKATLEAVYGGCLEYTVR